MTMPARAIFVILEEGVWPQRPGRGDDWVMWRSSADEPKPPADHDGDYWIGPGAWTYIAQDGEWHFAW